MTINPAQRRKSWLPETLAVVVVVVVVLAVSAVQLSRGSSSNARSSHEGVATSSGQDSERSYDPESYPPLSADTVKAVESSGAQVEVLDAAQVGPLVDEATAIKAAATEFGFTGQVGPTAEVSLVKLTLDDFGKETSNDPSISKLDLFVDHETEWLIVFQGVEIPIIGPRDQTGEEPTEPATYNADMYVIIDPTTGAFINARSIDPSGLASSK